MLTILQFQSANTYWEKSWTSIDTKLSCKCLACTRTVPFTAFAQDSNKCSALRKQLSHTPHPIRKPGMQQPWQAGESYPRFADERQVLNFLSGCKNKTDFSDGCHIHKPTDACRGDDKNRSAAEDEALSFSTQAASIGKLQLLGFRYIWIDRDRDQHPQVPVFSEMLQLLVQIITLKIFAGKVMHSGFEKNMRFLES